MSVGASLPIHSRERNIRFVQRLAHYLFTLINPRLWQDSVDDPDYATTTIHDDGMDEYLVIIG